MTEVEKSRDVFTQSHSPDRHYPMTSSTKRERHRPNRHTVHSPHSSHKRHRPHHKHPFPRSTKRSLPPGWEEVNSEGGTYYWHKKTGKTTWKFPSVEGTCGKERKGGVYKRRGIERRKELREGRERKRRREGKGEG